MIQHQIEHFYKRFADLKHKKDRELAYQEISHENNIEIIKLWRLLLVNPHQNHHLLHHATSIVKQILIFSKEKFLLDLNLNELSGIAKYIHNQKNFHHIADIIDILYFQKGVQVFPKSQELFLAFIKNFEFIDADEVIFWQQKLRLMICQILVELMMDNKQLVKWSNNPYFFMEYLLHLINQQEDIERVQYWFNCMKSLYQIHNAEDFLFFENDLRILVDILVRHIQNFETQKQLLCYLQTYLVLSLLKKLEQGSHYYKINDIVMVIGDINPQNKDLKTIIKEVLSLVK